MRIDQIEKHSFVADHLREGSRVFDLGANLGGFALEAIHRYGCRVLGVEPVPALAEAMPTHPLFTLRQAAITGGESSVIINVNPTSCASVGIRQEGADAVEVVGITFAALLGDHGTERVDLLKVDIEGAEIPLFDSSSDADLLRVDQVTVEFHDFVQPQLAADVVRVDARLRSLGFQRLAFSLDNTDVLYLHPRLALPAPQRAVMLARYKYARGAVRWARARVRAPRGLDQ